MLAFSILMIPVFRFVLIDSGVLQLLCLSHGRCAVVMLTKP